MGDFEFDLKLRPGLIAAIVVGLVVLVAVLFAVGGSFYSVPADSDAVVLRFGRYLKTTGPGLHGKLPFGIDRAIIVPVRRVESMEFGFQTVRAGRRSEYRVSPAQREAALMLTGDLNMASVEWVVQYRISDAKEYLFNVAGVEDTIRDVSDAMMRQLVGDRSVDDAITTGREELRIEAMKETQKVLDEYECGIEVRALNLQDATPPDPVKPAFDAVNSARQDKDKIINQAQAERNKKIPEARGEKEKKIAEAKGYMEEVVRSARGRAQAILSQYEEYRKRPGETRLRLFMETMEKVYAAAGRKFIVDPDVKGVLPLLDLGRGAEGGAR
ncbi:MAG: FtsH protease activity modulator HflK [Candidatus Eisenbacteria bacterium]|nr:FtsH protease activity modulator HflK [Candidatus Eisenbacteria bacterium]